MDVAYRPLGDMGPSATGTSAASVSSPAPGRSPRELAETSFRCWAGRDFSGISAFLADDVMTWFSLTVGDAEPVPVVNWCHVENGLIRAIRVAFDPRGMLAAR
jgi:hypothetical protein